MNKQPLTDRQQEILDWINEFIAKNSFPPSRREISTAFEFGANAATGHLNALANKGHIELIEGIARGIRVVP